MPCPTPRSQQRLWAMAWQPPLERRPTSLLPASGEAQEIELPNYDSFGLSSYSPGTPANQLAPASGQQPFPMGSKELRFLQRFARVFACGLGKIEPRLNQHFITVIRQRQNL